MVGNKKRKLQGGRVGKKILDVLLDELCLNVSQLLSALRIFYSYRLFCSEKYVGIFVFFNHKQFTKPRGEIKQNKHFIGMCTRRNEE